MVGRKCLVRESGWLDGFQPGTVKDATSHIVDQRIAVILLVHTYSLPRLTPLQLPTQLLLPTMMRNPFDASSDLTETARVASLPCTGRTSESAVNLEPL